MNEEAPSFEKQYKVTFFFFSFDDDEIQVGAFEIKY